MSESYDAAVEVRAAIDSLAQEIGHIPVADQRERIATAALAGLLANAKSSERHPVGFAMLAVEYADELISELTKKKE